MLKQNVAFLTFPIKHSMRIHIIIDYIDALKLGMIFGTITDCHLFQSCESNIILDFALLLERLSDKIDKKENI